MTWLAVTDWTVPLAFLVLAVIVVFAVLEVRLYHRTAEASPRLTARIPARERRLLGDDWRECVADYFREGFIRNTRTRLAVWSVTGADPYKDEAATFERPAS